MGTGNGIWKTKTNLISDSFDQSIYSYKESLYKTVPLQKGAGGNQWNDTEDTELRLEDAILADLNGAF